MYPAPGGNVIFAFSCPRLLVVTTVKSAVPEDCPAGIVTWLAAPLKMQSVPVRALPLIEQAPQSADLSGQNQGYGGHQKLGIATPSTTDCKNLNGIRNLTIDFA